MSQNVTSKILSYGVISTMTCRRGDGSIREIRKTQDVVDENGLHWAKTLEQRFYNPQGCEVVREQDAWEPERWRALQRAKALRAVKMRFKPSYWKFHINRLKHNIGAENGTA